MSFLLAMLHFADALSHQMPVQKGKIKEVKTKDLKRNKTVFIKCSQ